MERTTIQRIPYPLGLDAGNGARQIQDTAEHLEGVFVDLDRRWFYRNAPSAWQVRLLTAATADGLPRVLSFVTGGVDFDNRGNLAPVNSGSADTGVLGASGEWEYWYLGAYLNIAGGTTLDAVYYAGIRATGIDPLTNAATVQRIDRYAVESTTAGEHIVLDGFLRVRNATVQLHYQCNGAGTKTVAVGALFWAVQVGVE
jgi:hypothetical protein